MFICKRLSCVFVVSGGGAIYLENANILRLECVQNASLGIFTLNTTRGELQLNVSDALPGGFFRRRWVGRYTRCLVGVVVGKEKEGKATSAPIYACQYTSAQGRAETIFAVLQLQWL